MKIDFRTKLLVMLTITTICISGISQNDHPYLLLFISLLPCLFLFTQPLSLIEYKFVPLLMCSVNVADDVSISAMTRGMVVGNDRSTISTTKLRWQDYLCFCFVVVLWGVYIRSIYA